MSLCGDITAVAFELIPLPTDFGLILLQIALESGQLGSRFGIGLDQFTGALGHFRLKLNKLALLLGRLLGSFANSFAMIPRHR